MEHLGKIETIGVAWMTMLDRIIKSGRKTLYTDNAGERAPVTEIMGTVLTIEKIVLPDPIIERYQVKEEYDWMEDNFTRVGTVKELYCENSYASRLYAYMNEKNQIDWLIMHLKENLHTRSATLTTFEPLSDDKYIPCVSMIDFMVAEDRLDMYVYCRSLDFGCKAYINLVMLYRLAEQVAVEVGAPVGELNLIVKSAHVYDRDREKVDRILKDYHLA